MSTTRKTRSGVFSAGGFIPKKKTNSSKVALGEEEFLKMIELAKYEVDIDPYRGIRPLIAQQQQNLKNQASPNGPFELDVLKGSKDTPMENKDEKDLQQNNNLIDEENEGWWRSNCSIRNELLCNPTTSPDVPNTQTSTDSSSAIEIVSVTDSMEEQLRSIVGCTCPTLLKWMTCARQRKESRAGKRKRKRSSAAGTSNASKSGYFGRRYSDDADRECVCDYNPFCLVTLGGAMDDMLDQWVNERVITTIEQTQVNEVDPDDVIVLDDAVVVEDLSSDSPDGTTVPLDVFKPRTLNLLREVRKSTAVDERSIRLYLQKILPGLTEALPIDEGIAHISKLQESLVFTNPVSSYDHEGETTNTDVGHEIRFSMPPGIENLGATCYLNTQLQCLVQNLVFVDGIMSWRPSTGVDDDRMASVLALFQDLLLRMTNGPHSVVNTKDFSNALGLDHYEQQDPNEFSRLFFDRLHTSFQDGDDNRSIADLLPRLFQGVIAYETTCLACGTKSKRTEEFMDVNLPIVQRKATDSGAQTKVHLFQRDKLDTDVQICLNEYCSDEMLAGDNQYHCTNCEGKRDAKRALSFQKLPPVLNVQLCRYVFNREKLIKTKLSDKVLLPLHLDVQSFDGTRSENRFYLCAIMRHKGTSAYSGHYVAEAMDWRSGQWFEFNDDAVMHLRHGPSNCYNPSKVDVQLEEIRMAEESKSNHVESKSNQLVGSTDAYNMYYVEASFLAHCILEKMRVQSDIRGTNSETLMSDERSKHFEELRRMCLDDQRLASQLTKRRERLCVDVLPKLAAFSTSDLLNLVWVETSFLRQVLSCKELITTQLERKAILSPHDLLCSHQPGALHPRTARGGKLLPKYAYDSMMIILNEEIHDTEGNNFQSIVMTDSQIFLLGNLVCERCMRAYTSELDGKISFATAIVNLYDNLDLKEIKCLRYLKPGETINEPYNQYVYLVSRRFITWFRNKMIRFMKQANDAKSQAKLQLDNLPDKFKSIAMGLDGLNIEEFWNLKESNSSFGTIEACGIAEDDGISVRVNGHITCHHGNYKVNSSANSFVYVPWLTWQSIKAIFPAAIEHKRRRLTFSEEIVDSSEDDDDLFGCMMCSDEEASKNGLKRSINAFTKHCQTKQLFKFLPGDIIDLNTLPEDDFGFYLVSIDDYNTWRKVLAALSRCGKGKCDQNVKYLVESVLLNRGLEAKLQRLLPDSSESIASDDDLKIMGLFSRFFRSTLCDDHKLHVCEAFFRNLDHRERPLELKENICMIPEDDYLQFLSQVIAACIMLCRSEDESSWKEMTMDEMLSLGRSFLSKVKLTLHNHCTTLSSDTPESTNDRFFAKNKLFHLTEASCRSDACREAYKTMEAPSSLRVDISGTAENNSEIGDAIDVYSNEKSEPVTPLTVSLIVLDVKADAELSSVLNVLESVDGLSNRDGKVDNDYFRRRSSRKRSSRYCCGDVVSEEIIEICVDNNIAALRLALMERCTKGTEFELNHNLTLVFLMQLKADNQDESKTNDMEPLFKMIDLPFSSNTKTIRGICEEGFGGPYESSISTFLIRQANIEPSTENIARDELMDTLLSLANAPTDIKTKTKKPRTEKGFTGTFLSLTTVPKAAVVSTESNDVVALPTTALSQTTCDKNDTLHFQDESAQNSKVIERTEEIKIMQPSASDMHVPSDDVAEKPAAVYDKIRRLSNSSIQYGETEQVTLKHQLKAKRRSPHVEPDKTISIDDDSSDNDIDLLQSPCSRSSNNASPSKQFATKKIKLSSSGVQSTSKYEKKKEKSSNNGRKSSLLDRSNDGYDSQLTSEIVRLLLTNPDLQKQCNEEICHLAAENAIAMHPHLDEAPDLIEAAYALYLELTLP